MKMCIFIYQAGSDVGFLFVLDFFAQDDRRKKYSSIVMRLEVAHYIWNIHYQAKVWTHTSDLMVFMRPWNRREMSTTRDSSLPCLCSLDGSSKPRPPHTSYLRWVQTFDVSLQVQCGALTEPWRLHSSPEVSKSKSCFKTFQLPITTYNTIVTSA